MRCIPVLVQHRDDRVADIPIPIQVAADLGLLGEQLTAGELGRLALDNAFFAELLLAIDGPRLGEQSIASLGVGD